MDIQEFIKKGEPCVLCKDKYDGDRETLKCCQESVHKICRGIYDRHFNKCFKCYRKTSDAKLKVYVLCDGAFAIQRELAVLKNVDSVVNGYKGIGVRWGGTMTYYMPRSGDFGLSASQHERSDLVSKISKQLDNDPFASLY